MAQYFDDFESYSTGSRPAGYSLQWDASSGFTCKTFSSQKTLAKAGIVSRDACSYDAVSSDGNRDNVEVLALVETSSAGSGSQKAGVVCRGSGTGSAETGYAATIISSELRLNKYSSGTSTALATTSGKSLASNTKYWIRLRVNGTSLKARIWADGGSEPGTWDHDTTDSAVSGVGWAGLYTATTSNDYWYQIGVGTNGDTAPSSTPAAGATSFGFGPQFPRPILNF